MRVARSKSRIPSAGPSSQCGFGSKSIAGGVPQRRTSALSAADFPAGTLSCGRFGSVSKRASRRCSIARQLRFQLADAAGARLVLRENSAGIASLALGLRHLTPPRRSVRASDSRRAESAGGAPPPDRSAPPDRRTDPARARAAALPRPAGRSRTSSRIDHATCPSSPERDAGCRLVEPAVGRLSALARVAGRLGRPALLGSSRGLGVALSIAGLARRAWSAASPDFLA